MKGLFLDIDGTLTGTISGKTFKQHPRDVAVLPGADKALQYYQKADWVMVGISNQGGVAAGHKSIQDAIAEMKYTLKLLPYLSSIYFCPDFDGVICWKITPSSSDGLEIKTESGDFRKPGAGMVNLAINEYQIEKIGSWYVGDRPEDEQCASTAGVQYMDAEIWRNRFLPGVHEIKPATIEQVRFLENIKF